ncbi:5-methylcytosine restriction system specificity protein McrC [Marinitoga litoralis]|uniref:5-methylcytosine restriction system specificity protein McrC n=1 Tax=Marinitoga litoralis TaxID=570855 RepID=UPI00195F4949|nr:hypothetical protein [Marinitoga litoralis]MBM7560463.1 5-methylcytosine-specific restriction endonuclease McrBC regulatory subunit McrC [Marinitoga litoralis]
MKKIKFIFSDYSGYKKDYKAYIDEKNYIIINEKYKYNKDNDKDNEYFQILCEFIKKFRTRRLEIDISESYYEDNNENIDTKYGTKISSKIMDINLDTREIMTKGYIGVLRGNIELEGKGKYDVIIEIGSRFDKGKKQLFLRYLLSQVYKVNLYKQSNPKADEEDSIWKWLIIIAFKNRLENAFKNGLYKRYKRFEKNDCNIKGTIDIERFIKYNIPFNGKVAYNKRELTHDNDIMHLILHAYDILNKKYPEKISKFINKNSKAYEAISTIKEVAPNYKNENIKSLMLKCFGRINHPYYHNYEPLRKISLLIIKNKGVSFFGGKSSDIIGVIVNIGYLWEQFLYENVLKKIEEIELIYQDMIKLILKKEEEIIRKFSLKPDFVIKGGENKYVLDAKYKMGWEIFISSINSKPNIEYIINDYRQITNYVYLLNANWGGAIFPFRDNEQDLTEFHFTHNQNKHFYLFGLKVPNTEDSDKWLEIFNVNIETLIKKIESKIDNV